MSTVQSNNTEATEKNAKEAKGIYLPTEFRSYSFLVIN